MAQVGVTNEWTSVLKLVRFCWLWTSEELMSASSLPKQVLQAALASCQEAKVALLRRRGVESKVTEEKDAPKAMSSGKESLVSYKWCRRRRGRCAFLEKGELKWTTRR